jgi:hypothetical protein
VSSLELGAFLEDAGYTVLVAADGMEGVGVFKQHQSDIAAHNRFKK